MLSKLNRKGISSISIEELEAIMQKIPVDSRRALEIRWGLVGNVKTCPQYKMLSQKLEVEDSKAVLDKAYRELDNQKYIDLLVDADKFERDLAANLGRFAKVVNRAQEESVYGETLLEIMCSNLGEREREILTQRFGLEKPFKTMSLDAVGKNLNL